MEQPVLSDEKNYYAKFDEKVEEIVHAFKTPISFAQIQRFLDKNGWPVDEYFVRESVHRLVGEGRCYYAVEQAPFEYSDFEYSPWKCYSEGELLVGSRPPDCPAPCVVTNSVPRTVESSVEITEALLCYLVDATRGYDGDCDLGNGWEFISARYTEGDDNIVFWLKDEDLGVRTFTIPITSVNEVKV